MAGNALPTGNPPRANCHAANPLVDLCCALALSFFFEELLRNKELGSCLFLGGIADFGQAVGEIGPALSQVACDGNGVDNVAVFVCIQQLPAPTQRVIYLLG